MSDSFYRAFEEKHRGSRELIKSRLQVYLPFVQPLLNTYPAGKVLDVGCGRGEWLELMVEQGFDALGVDLDDGMLQACRERNLKVETSDAVAYLQGLTESSICVVSGFHIAEHLPFEVLQQLVQQALRVLVPGGLLILETPNPENIVVGTSSFYLDPTHKRPIPAELLSFLPEHYGFARYKTLRLQESMQLHGEPNIQLIHVISGVSPDFAVVAQKLGGLPLMESLDQAFDKQYGITLLDLALRHEHFFERRFLSIEAKVQQVEAKAQQAEAKAQQAEAKAQQAEAKAQQAEASSLVQALQLEAIYNSRSWRITAPIRWLMFQLRLLRSLGFKQRAKAAAKKLAIKIIFLVATMPRLKLIAIWVVKKLGFMERLQPFVHSLYAFHQAPIHHQRSSQDQVSLVALNPRAKKIYHELKLDLKKKHTGGV